MLHIGSRDAQMLFEETLIFVIDATQNVGLATTGNEHALYALAFETRKHIVSPRHSSRPTHALKIARLHLIKAASLLYIGLRAETAAEKQIDSSHTRHALVEIKLIARGLDAQVVGEVLPCQRVKRHRVEKHTIHIYKGSLDVEATEIVGFEIAAYGLY